jgi:hypothetical protein
MTVGPSLNAPESMTPQLYDLDVVSAPGAAPSSDWTPRTGFGFARAILIGTAGSIVVDTLGVGGSGGQTSQTIALPAGVTYLAITKIHHTSTTAQGVAALY